MAQRGPAADELAAKQREAAAAAQERDGAAAALAAANEAQAAVQGMLEGLEADVEAVRARAVRGRQRRDRSAARHRERRERARPRLARPGAAGHRARRPRRRGRARAGGTRGGRGGARVTPARSWTPSLRDAHRRARPRSASLRAQRDRLAQDAARTRTGRGEAAARQHSLEEFEPARAAYGDAARSCWPSRPAPCSTPDPWPTISTSRRASSGPSKPVWATCCSTWSSRRTKRPRRGLALVRRRAAGRCGFAVVGDGALAPRCGRAGAVPGLTSLGRSCPSPGRTPDAIRPLVTAGWVAASFTAAVAARRARRARRDDRWRRVPGPAPRRRRVRARREPRHPRHQARHPRPARAPRVGAHDGDPAGRDRGRRRTPPDGRAGGHRVA